MSRTSRAALVAALTLLVGSVGLGAGPAPTRAATPALTLASDTTYEVLPDTALVHVTSLVTATNHLQDTLTKRFFFRTAYLAVLPGTSGFKVAATGLKPSVSVSVRTSTYTLLKLNLGTDLGAGKSVTLTLTFDIKDPGGAPDRPVRISPSIISFTAWSFATADTPGSSVTVRFPDDYTVSVGRGPLKGPTIDGSGLQVWTSGKLASPLAFIADLTADRPGDFDDTRLSAQLGSATARIDLRSWPDDPAWRDRVGDLLTRGLPALAAEIGVPWPVKGELTVQEALVRNTGGYAGLYDPTTGIVLISYTASSSVVLHEAAHAWFNGRLVADRWAAEAFASYYSARAATALKLKVTNPALTDAVKVHAFPLNEWGAIGVVPADAEAYGYAASFAFASAVAERAGSAAMAAVWAKAASGGGAYQPVTGAEPTGRVPDWRSLLDLFEDATGKPFDDLWRQWIARPTDLVLLDQRAAARAAYDKALTDAGAWTLPRSIRDALRAWQFNPAMAQLAAAESVLGQRADLTAAASIAGVGLPRTLEASFEGDAGLAAAAAEASAELTTVEAIRQAELAQPANVPGTPGVLILVGLVGEDPVGELGAAKAAFAAGDLQGAIASASAAAADWTAAAEQGRTRLVSIGLLVLALLLIGRTLILHRWRRRSGWSDD